MKVFACAAVLMLSAAASAPAWSDTNDVPAATVTSPASHTSDAPNVRQAHVPVLRVGVSDPNTQLILPWFLADIVDGINNHTPPGDLLRKAAHDL
ncbi:hypothetical protein [Paraburkholderia sp.]|uniref:hypothetical protein n=1 Tax=Paraburkholderia sp. TaxID=1926495 RepID=UPI003D6E5229